MSFSCMIVPLVVRGANNGIIFHHRFSLLFTYKDHNLEFQRTQFLVQRNYSYIILLFDLYIQ
jgi:hypothetical protein